MKLQYEEMKNISNKFPYVIQCTHDYNAHFTKGKLYAVQKNLSHTEAIIDDIHEENGFYYEKHAKAVKTKLPDQAKIGDKVICCSTPEDTEDYIKINDILTIKNITIEDCAYLYTFFEEKYYIYKSKDFHVIDQAKVVIGDTIKRTEILSAFEYGEEHIIGKLETVVAIYGHNAVAVENSNIYINSLDYEIVHSTNEPTIPNLCNEIMLPTKQIKEKEMSKIEIKVNGKEIDLCNKAEVVKPQTDYERKLPYMMIVYNVNGSYCDTYYNKTKKGIKKDANAYLQKPANLGKTVTIHKCIDELTTQVPVIKVQ